MPNVSNTKCCQTSQGYAVESEAERPQAKWWQVRLSAHMVERYKSGVERHSIRKTWR